MGTGRAMADWAVLGIVLLALGWLGAQTPPKAASASQAAAYHRVEQAGYQAFYSLDYPAALADFRRLRRMEPENPAVWNHLAQARLYQEMYRVGALRASLYGKSNAFFDARLKPLNRRACARFLAADRKARQLAQGQLARHPHRADAAYALAAAWGLEGTYDFALRKAYFSALRDAVRADKYARQAARQRPGWAPPQLILGVHDYVAGSLPWTVRWFAHLAGLSGSRKEGLARIRRVATGAAPERVEARILLAVMDRRQGWNRRAAGWLRGLRRRYPRNALFAAELAAAEEAAGEHRKALADYQWLTRAPHPDAPSYAELPWGRIWLAIGGVNRELGRLPAALQAYGRVQQARGAPAPVRQQAALAAGEIEDAAGRRQAALADYRLCLAVDDTGPAARRARRWMATPFSGGGRSR